MKSYTIYLHGCDDTTEFEIELTEAQAELVRIMVDKSEEASEYGCQPVMQIFVKETE